MFRTPSPASRQWAPRTSSSRRGRSRRNTRCSPARRRVLDIVGPLLQSSERDRGPVARNRHPATHQGVGTPHQGRLRRPPSPWRTNVSNSAGGRFPVRRGAVVDHARPSLRRHGARPHAAPRSRPRDPDRPRCRVAAAACRPLTPGDTARSDHPFRSAEERCEDGGVGVLVEAGDQAVVVEAQHDAHVRRADLPSGRVSVTTCCSTTKPSPTERRTSEYVTLTRRSSTPARTP